MEWTYRIIRSFDEGGAVVYSLNVVWFAGEEIVAWNEAPESFYAKTLADLKSDLFLALQDSEMEVLQLIGGELYPYDSTSE